MTPDTKLDNAEAQDGAIEHGRVAKVFHRREPDWKKVLEDELKRRAQLEAFWAAEREAAGEVKPKDQG